MWQQGELRHPGTRQRIDGETIRFQLLEPSGDELPHSHQVQPLVRRWIVTQSGQGEFEECCGRTQAVFLQMHKCAGKLDEPLVKIAIRTAPVRQPQVFQNVMRFVKLLPVKQNKVAGIMRVHTVPGELPDHFHHAFVFVHALTVIRYRPGARQPAWPTRSKTH